MVVERRFLIASSLARLIQRESVTTARICEGHFAPQGERRQLVRVERERAMLVLVSREEGGAPTEEQAEVPHAHAEALIDVAAGAVAFDRTPVRIGHDVEAVLDRFVVPQGIDILTVTIRSDPRAFAPPLWAGMEVTGDASFEAAALALNGLPAFGEIEISNMALESLLDMLDGRGSYRFRPRPPQTQAELGFAAARPRPPADLPALTDLDAPSRFEASEETAPETADSASSTASLARDRRTAPETADSAPAIPEGEQALAAAPFVEVTPNVREAEAEGSRRPVLRTGPTVELDEEIARLARTLAPRGQRSF